MKVVLCITNVDGFHETPYPFGLSSIAAYIMEKGHDCKLLVVRDESEYESFLEEVVKFDPAVVGFSSVSSQFSFVCDLAKLLRPRLNNNAVIVCGGIHTTLFPEAVAFCPELDGVFVGESEVAFNSMLSALNQGKDIKQVSNLAYSDGLNVVINELLPLLDYFDDLPHPYKGKLYSESIKTIGAAPFFFARGCPYNCSYCSNHGIAARYGLKRNSPRFPSVDWCIKEIETTSQLFDFEKILIGDDTFGIDRKWRNDFLAQYAEKIALPFQCLLRVNVINEEFVRLLAEAGCYRISFGVESGNDYIRNKVMKRNISRKQIVDAFSLCRKYGIETVALNIIGVPGEDDNMIQDTVDLNIEIKPTSTCANIFYPYRGTELGDYCFNEGLVDESIYSSFSMERRGSVLNFPAEFKDKLIDYHENWYAYTHPYDLKAQFFHFLVKHRRVHMTLRWIRRRVFGKRSD